MIDLCGSLSIKKADMATRQQVEQFLSQFKMKLEVFVLEAES